MGEGVFKVVEAGDKMGDIARKRHFHVDICSYRASGGLSGIGICRAFGAGGARPSRSRSPTPSPPQIGGVNDGDLIGASWIRQA